MAQQAGESFAWRVWSSRGLFAWLLSPLSLLFLIVSSIRRALAKPVRLPVPVVVVGNTFVGGTGKTPVVIYLCELLKRNGYTPGVVSRGYRSSSKTPTLVATDTLASVAGDEPVLIAKRTGCPVCVCPDRVEAGRALLAARPDVDIIVSDDGLQHYRLARDVEIIVFDSRLGLNGFVLPAGPLREPMSRTADFTVINAAGGKDSLASGLPDSLKGAYFADMALDGFYSLKDAARVKSAGDFPKDAKDITAAAGIGNPAKYFASLEKAGLAFTGLPLPDHYAFDENPFAQVTSGVVLITEKDAVKCSQNKDIASDDRIWVARSSLVMTDPGFDEAFLGKCRGSETA